MDHRTSVRIPLSSESQVDILRVLNYGCATDQVGVQLIVLGKPQDTYMIECDIRILYDTEHEDTMSEWTFFGFVPVDRSVDVYFNLRSGSIRRIKYEGVWTEGSTFFLQIGIVYNTNTSSVWISALRSIPFETQLAELGGREMFYLYETFSQEKAMVNNEMCAMLRCSVGYVFDDNVVDMLRMCMLLRGYDLIRITPTISTETRCMLAVWIAETKVYSELHDKMMDFVVAVNNLRSQSFRNIIDTCKAGLDRDTLPVADMIMFLEMFRGANLFTINKILQEVTVPQIMDALRDASATATTTVKKEEHVYKEEPVCE